MVYKYNIGDTVRTNSGGIHVICKRMQTPMVNCYTLDDVTVHTEQALESVVATTEELFNALREIDGVTDNIFGKPVLDIWRDKAMNAIYEDYDAECITIMNKDENIARLTAIASEATDILKRICPELGEVTLDLLLGDAERPEIANNEIKAELMLANAKFKKACSSTNDTYEETLAFLSSCESNQEAMAVLEGRGVTTGYIINHE